MRTIPILAANLPGMYVHKFLINPKDVHDLDRRSKAKAWLKGEGIYNQGLQRGSGTPRPIRLTNHTRQIPERISGLAGS